MKLRIALALLMTIVLNMSAYAETTDMVEQRYLGWTYNNGEGVKKDYKKAAYWFEKAALQGDWKSQKRLGFMYKKGEGVEQDYDQALYWLEKAALQGDKAATATMGYLYKNKKKDYHKAIYWFKKALLLNDSGAAKALGYMHKNGQGFRKDVKRAVELFTKSATQGNKHGQRALGISFLYGKGVEKDYRKAYYWLNKAALQGNEKAQKDLFKMRDKGLIPEDKIQEPMPTIEEARADFEAENYKESFRKFTILAKQGNADAYAGLAAILLEGLGLDPDLDKAFEYAKKSAELGSDDGKFLLGAFYYHGIGVNRDPVKGLKIMKKASRNDKEARELYEQLLEEYNNERKSLAEAEKKLLEEAFDDYSEKRYKDAFGKFLKLSEQGNATAQDFLGDMYFNREGVERSVKKAVFWYKKASEQDDRYAKFSLGKLYIDGNGVEKNIRKGLVLITQAAKLGSKGAEAFLKKREPSQCKGRRATGTGFAVSKDGVIATNHHVVSGGGCQCKEIRIGDYRAEVISKDKMLDIALIKSNKTYKKVASLSINPLPLAEDVYLFGWPLGDFFSSLSVTKGVVNGRQGSTGMDKSRFRHTAEQNYGNSGGPVVSVNDGKVLGLTYAGFAGRTRVNKCEKKKGAQDKLYDECKEKQEKRKKKRIDERIVAQNINYGVRVNELIKMMNSAGISISTKPIPVENVVEHYEDISEKILCVYSDS